MKNKTTILSLLIISLLNLFAVYVFSVGILDKNTNEKKHFKNKNRMFLNSTPAVGPYSNAIGINASLNSGITYKHFIADEKAFEVDLGTRWRGISVTGIFEMCIAAGSVGPGLIWNFGLGPRLGFYNGKNYMDYLGRNRENRTYSSIGMVGNIGFENFFPKMPFTVGLDYRPYYDLNGKNDNSFLDAVISLRYAF